MIGPATEDCTPDSHLRTAPLLSPSTHAMDTADVERFVIEALTKRPAIISYDQDFYQYAWFRLLILLILVLIFMVVIFAFAFMPDFLWEMRLYRRELAIIFLPVPVYTLFFVFLEDYRDPISDYLRALRIRRDVQRNYRPTSRTLY